MTILQKIASTALVAAFAISPAFAYGGGGGGGANYSNPSLIPSISGISPLKSSLQASSFPISFVVSGNPDEDSVAIEVDGNAIPVDISPLGGGTFEARGIVDGVTGESALIKLSATSAYSASSVRTYIYPVTIVAGLESAILVAPRDETENTPYEVVLFNPGVKQNLCDIEQTFNDAVVDGSTEYTDIRGNKNEKYIEDLTQRCIVNGYQGTQKFEPNKVFNRAEAVKTVVKGFGYNYPTSVADSPFSDVKAYEWFSPYLTVAKKYGIVRGYAGGKFAPDNGMNVVEGLAIVARASKTDLSEYQTGSGIWYNSYLKWGIAKGLVDANVQPDTALTRGAFARMVSLR